MEYQLLDSGDGRKLERVGPYVLDRPSAQAHWRRRLPDREWSRADAHFHRRSAKGGDWKLKRPLPDSWPISVADLQFHIKLTDFGHLGIFPEQLHNWQSIRQRIERSTTRPYQVLNLFAYTGGSTIAAAQGGASVVHVDASKTSVAWARENASRSGIDPSSVRWMVDDVNKFLAREMRRGHNYHGIIMDPPSFGRGASGQVWKIETHLPKLLASCASLLHKSDSFVLVTAHSPGMSGIGLKNMMADSLSEKSGEFRVLEMTISERESTRCLPSGVGCLYDREPLCDR